MADGCSSRLSALCHLAAADPNSFVNTVDFVLGNVCGKSLRDLPPWELYVGPYLVDVPALFASVVRYGGFHAVQQKNLWNDVLGDIRMPELTEHEIARLVLLYAQWLLPVESAARPPESVISAATAAVEQTMPPDPWKHPLGSGEMSNSLVSVRVSEEQYAEGTQAGQVSGAAASGPATDARPALPTAGEDGSADIERILQTEARDYVPTDAIEDIITATAVRLARACCDMFVANLQLFFKFRGVRSFAAYHVESVVYGVRALADALPVLTDMGRYVHAIPCLHMTVGRCITCSLTSRLGQGQPAARRPGVKECARILTTATRECSAPLRRANRLIASSQLPVALAVEAGDCLEVLRQHGVIKCSFEGAAAYADGILALALCTGPKRAAKILEKMPHMHNDISFCVTCHMKRIVRRKHSKGSDVSSQVSDLIQVDHDRLRSALTAVGKKLQRRALSSDAASHGDQLEDAAAVSSERPLHHNTSQPQRSDSQEDHYDGTSSPNAAYSPRDQRDKQAPAGAPPAGEDVASYAAERRPSEELPQANPVSSLPPLSDSEEAQGDAKSANAAYSPRDQQAQRASTGAPSTLDGVASYPAERRAGEELRPPGTSRAGGERGVSPPSAPAVPSIADIAKLAAARAEAAPVPTRPVIAETESDDFIARNAEFVRSVNELAACWKTLAPSEAVFCTSDIHKSEKEIVLDNILRLARRITGYLHGTRGALLLQEDALEDDAARTLMRNGSGPRVEKMALGVRHSMFRAAASARLLDLLLLGHDCGARGQGGSEVCVACIFQEIGVSPLYAAFRHQLSECDTVAQSLALLLNALCYVMFFAENPLLCVRVFGKSSATRARPVENSQPVPPSASVTMDMLANSMKANAARHTGHAADSSQAAIAVQVGDGHALHPISSAVASGRVYAPSASSSARGGTVHELAGQGRSELVGRDSTMQADEGFTYAEEGRKVQDQRHVHYGSNVMHVGASAVSSRTQGAGTLSHKRDARMHEGLADTAQRDIRGHTDTASLPPNARDTVEQSGSRQASLPGNSEDGLHSSGTRKRSFAESAGKADGLPQWAPASASRSTRDGHGGLQVS